jgi:hypothetical protein
MRTLTPVLIGTIVAVCAVAGRAVAAPAADSVYQSEPVVSSKKGLSAEEFSSQSRKVLQRAPRRVRIYAPREPGPNSVRICSSWYEYEHRVSGTVIVPRESCHWSG